MHPPPKINLFPHEQPLMWYNKQNTCCYFQLAVLVFVFILTVFVFETFLLYHLIKLLLTVKSKAATEEC